MRLAVFLRERRTLLFVHLVVRFLALFVAVERCVAFVAGFEGFGGFLAVCAGGLGFWVVSEREGLDGAD